VAHPFDPYVLFGNIGDGALRQRHYTDTTFLGVGQRMPQGQRCAKAKQVLL
jgi:hypothetical protein